MCLSRVQQRALDRDAWEAARKGLDYNESALPELPPDTMPSTLALAVVELLRIFGVLAIVVALVYFLVRLVVRRRRKGASLGEVMDSPAYDAAVPTALSSYEVLQHALEEARRRGDYREALRLLYQMVLHRLNALQYIEAHPDKTNWEYVRELGAGVHAHPFATLTLLFERGWYGNGHIEATHYARAEARFREFLNALKS
jgi:hypothetical protein